MNFLWIGTPDDCNTRDFVQTNWFESMRMWTEIQRDIHAFNTTFKGRSDKPKIHNFAVVPICSFQRRHIRIDTDALYNILCKTKTMQQKPGNRKLKDGISNQANIDTDDFRMDPIASWNLYFDVENFLKLGRNKREFYVKFVRTA